MDAANNSFETPKGSLRALRVFALALMVGVTLFSVIAVVVNQLNGPGWKEETSSFQGILRAIGAFLVGFCQVIARKIYDKKVKNIALQPNSLQEKLNQYRAALIIFLALCEGGALFCIVLFFVTGDYVLLLGPAIMLGFMAFKIPTAKKLTLLLNLDWNEQQELE